MKKFISTLLSLLFISSLSAQPTLQRDTHLPRSGDRLNRQVYNFCSPGTSGTNLLWDFSKAAPTGESSAKYYYRPTANSDTLVGVERGTLFYYVLRADSLLLLGSENPSTALFYSAPELVNIFPLCYGDKHLNYFDEQGHYRDKVCVRSCGKLKQEACGTGTLVLPAGDTLRQVLCVHTDRRFTDRVKSLAAQDSALLKPATWLPVNADSVERQLVTDTLRLQQETWQWYAEGSRYPVMESSVYRTFVRDSLVTEDGFSLCYPPQKQYYDLADDPDNHRTTAAQAPAAAPAANHGNASGRQGENTEAAPVITAAKLDASGTLTVEYNTGDAAAVFVALYDMQGRQLGRLKPTAREAGSYRDVLDIGNCPPGEYMVTVSADGRTTGLKVAR